MKGIIVFLLIIIIAIFGWSQYHKYKGYHPPSAYEYIINDDVDIAYWDETVVEQYLSNAEKIGSFARQSWRNQRVDVKFPNQKKETAIWAANEYNRMIAQTKQLELRLVQSKELKNKGLENSDIKQIELSGDSPEDFLQSKNENQKKKLYFDFLSGSKLRIGSKGQEVLLLQKLLNNLGAQLEEDGIFKQDTEIALKQFQENKLLFISGILDDITLDLLVEN